MSRRRRAVPVRGTGTVRIIGGAWRRSRLAVPDVAGLRPTGDRIRETLFNWLGPTVDGARCADLFAGTGALGLEAASRGAKSVVLLETDYRATNAIREEAARLESGAPTGCEVRVVEADALGWLEARASGAAAPLDIVFVDPPFGSGLVQPALQLLARPSVLSANARVYIETGLDQAFTLPVGLASTRSESAGQVRYHLAAPAAG